jgi:hypothetical protein
MVVLLRYFDEAFPRQKLSEQDVACTSYAACNYNTNKKGNPNEVA